MKTGLKPHHKDHSSKREMLRIAVGTAALLAVIGVLVSLSIAGRTDWWPGASECAVVGSRVVVADVARGSMRDQEIVYRGEYRIRYVASGKTYFTWVESEWTDADKQFVEENLSKLPQDCPVRVQYNPLHPAENVAHLVPSR